MGGPLREKCQNAQLGEQISPTYIVSQQNVPKQCMAVRQASRTPGSVVWEGIIQWRQQFSQGFIVISSTHTQLLSPLGCGLFLNPCICTLLFIFQVCSSSVHTGGLEYLWQIHSSM